jgi:hypothetical protein
MIDEVQEVVAQVFLNLSIEHEIYLSLIPSEVVPNPNILEVLLEEEQSSPSGYSDGTFHRYDESTSIAMFYGNEYDLPMPRIVLEVELQKALIASGMNVQSSQAHYIDPDTKQVIKNITVTRTKGLDEIV